MIVLEWKFEKFIKGIVLTFKGHHYGIIRVGNVTFLLNESSNGSIMCFKDVVILGEKPQKIQGR